MLETVSRSYSYKLVLRSALIILLGAAITVAILYFSMNRGPGGSYAESYNVIAGLRQEMLHKSLVIYASISCLIIIGIVVISLLYSHRIAGPLHRLEMAARRIAGGDFTERVKLRQEDVIHPMADDLNGLAAAYSDTVNTLEARTAELRRAVSELSALPGAASERDIRNAKNRISGKTNEIKDVLSAIRL
jgi:methyl-accepting chemotaxis protein